MPKGPARLRRVRRIDIRLGSQWPPAADAEHADHRL